MILHTDIPTRGQVDRLLLNRDPASVSIYIPTDPTSANVGERIELRTLGAEAVRQLREERIARRKLPAIEDQLADLHDDESFWRYQARSLATFITPDSLLTFRLPNRLTSIMETSDRFHLSPLLRTLTFPQVAFVLALAEGSVRVIEVSADLPPERVRVTDLPKDAASATRRPSLRGRAPVRRIQGSEGRKVLLRQYARHIDNALRPLLAGLDVPLILAGTEPLDSIFRSVSSYPHLAPTTIPGNPAQTSDADLAASARHVLDELYAKDLRATRRQFRRLAPERRALSDIAEVARAATYGAVDTVLVDIDEVVPGYIDEETGAVTFASTPEAVVYGVVDEIARRVWLTGGRVLAVRRQDIPGRVSLAAILRRPM